MMAFYPLAAQATVMDLLGTCAFLQDALAFPVRTRSEHAAEIDNGTVVVRLIQGERNTPLSLVLLASDMDQATAALLSHPEVLLQRDEHWASPTRKEVTLRYAGWLELILAREFDEDELGLCPDLPTELEWEPPAYALLQSLIARVPVPYRASARGKSTRGAEALTVEKGEVVVHPFEAVRGLIRATPVFQHPSLWRALSEAGQDPKRWEPELVRELRW